MDSTHDASLWSEHADRYATHSFFACYTYFFIIHVVRMRLYLIFSGNVFLRSMTVLSTFRYGTLTYRFVRTVGYADFCYSRNGNLK